MNITDTTVNIMARMTIPQSFVIFTPSCLVIPVKTCRLYNNNYHLLANVGNFGLV